MSKRTTSQSTLKRVPLRVCVKKQAEAKGFTVLSLAKASGVAYATIKRLWERPDSDTKMSTLEKLAFSLDINPLDLLEVVPSDEEHDEKHET